MRVNAYVLAGDPAWAGLSLSSYYGLVEKIVVSFDSSHRSWSGHPIPVEAALHALTAADPEKKIVLLPGDHCDPQGFALSVETEQRQRALDAASEACDWVLQLDTDEIVQSPETLLHYLRKADSRGADGLDFPLRDFYQRVSRGRYLEHCGRFWTDQAAYPGPVAVRSGTKLAHCRQTAVALYRVDMRPRNSDPGHPRDVRVHAVVPATKAIAHMSWVRDPEDMLRKSRTSGHAKARDWNRDLALWEWRGQHPYLAAATAPARRDPFARFRIAKLDI